MSGAARDGSEAASVDPHLATLEEITRLLVEEASLEQLLEQLLAPSARALETSAAISVTMVEDDGRYVTAAASEEAAAAIDALQLELAEGPCIDAIQQGAERYAADLVGDGRWPGVAERAVAYGFQGVLVVPLLVDGACVGALNVFGRGCELTTADREFARRLAVPVATTLTNARAYRRVSRLAGQLSEALDSRATIERAKGVLMVREGCDAETAFELLRRASQDHNRKLRDVARAVLEPLEDGAARDGAG